MFCIKCGFKNTEISKFCIKCGAKLITSAAEPPTPAAVPAFEQTAPIAEPPAPAAVPAFEQPVTPYVYEAQPMAYNLSTPNGTAVKKRRPLAVRIIFPIFFGILIFALLFSSLVLLSARSTLISGELSAAIKDVQPLNIVVGDIIHDSRTANDAERLLKQMGTDSSYFNKSATVSDVVYRALNHKVTRAQLNEIVQETELMGYIANVVGDYENYLLTNENNTSRLSASYLKLVLSENLGKVSRICGMQLELSDDIIEDYDETLRKFAPATAFNGYGAITSAAFSIGGIAAVLAAAVIFTVLVGFICKSWFAPMMTFGICALLSGSVFIVLYLLADGLAGAFGIGFAAVNSVIVPIVKNTLLLHLFTFGMITAAIGVIIIAAAIVTNTIAKHHAKKNAYA